MLHRIIYTFVFLVSFSSLGQMTTCNKKSSTVDINSIAKCIIGKSKKNKLKKSKIRNRIRLRRKSRIKVSSRITPNSRITANSNIESNKELASLRTKLNFISKISSSNKTLDKFPLSIAEVKPSFPNCVGTAKNNQEKCFRDELINHIQNKFNYPEKAFESSIQGKVTVSFVINEFGQLEDIKSTRIYKGKELENEAKRIIKALPKFVSPGKMGNTAVKVKYSIPIQFKIIGREASNIIEKQRENVNVKDIRTINSVESLPAFEKCKFTAKILQKNCFNKELTEHVNNNIEYPQEAIDNNLEDRVFVLFVIDSQGDVINVTSKSHKGHKILEDEAKRIIRNMPKLIPAKVNGNSINMKHSIPINFKL